MFSTYGPRFGLEVETALKISSAFGGGIGRTGDVCGAVIGALMAIGLEYGRTKPNDDEAKEKTYHLSQEFLQKFRERNDSIVCRDLLGVDISAPDGRERIEELGLEEKVCQKAVRDAAEILEEILYRTPHRYRSFHAVK